jgi:hypothetical protein
MKKEILTSLHGNKIGLSRDNSLIINGEQAFPLPNPTGAMDYFVDGNRSASGDGLSWGGSYKTLAAAITASNASIALTANRWWARRNRIFVVGDSITENLAAIPQKCDVIGLGSCDAYPMASIKGNHAPLTEMFGCRFYNVRFIPATAAVIWTLIANNNGIKFIGCQGVGSQDAITATSFISTTATELLDVIDCDIDGAFSGDIIAIGAGNASGLKIIGNNIRGGANDGIVIDAGATYTSVNGLPIIKKNTIQVAGCTIRDAPDNAIVTDNDLISAAANGTASLDINKRYAARNWCTDATKEGWYPPVE